MTNGANGSASWMKWLLQVIVLTGALLGAWLTLDARIASAVAAESRLRQQDDVRLEELVREVRDELRDLNKYLRERSSL